MAEEDTARGTLAGRGRSGGDRGRQAGRAARRPGGPDAGTNPPRHGAVPNGFSLVFATEGLAFGGLGLVLQRPEAVVAQVLGGVTILLWCVRRVLDRFPMTGRIVRPSIQPPPWWVPPCSGAVRRKLDPLRRPTLSVVLSLALTLGTAVRGAVLAFLYGLGLGIPFIIVALALQRGVTVFQFARRHAQLIARIGGGLLVLVGLLEVTGAWTSAITWLKIHWLASFTSPL